jgi:PAS domain S-box-containing protein
MKDKAPGQQPSDSTPQGTLTLAQVIDFLPDPTFAIDLDRTVVAWNKALEELLGVGASSMIGTSDYSLAFYGARRPMLADLVLGDDVKFEKTYLSIERQGDTIMAEGDVVTPGGTVRLWGKASPIYDGHGTVIGAISTVRDITSRAVAEHSLQESRRMLAQVIDFLPDPTFAIDAQGRVIVWNRAMEELTKVPAAQMIGRGDHEYALPFYGTRRPILIDLTLGADREIEKKYAFIERDGDSLMAETDTILNGERVSLWGKASPFYDGEGRVVGAIESIRDVTQRKIIEEELRKSQEKIRDIYENVTDFLYVHDLEGTFLESNFFRKTSYGYTKKEIKKLTVHDFLADEERPFFNDFIARIVEKGWAKGTFRVKAKDGSIRILEYSDTLIRDEHGRPALIRGSARDVTERVLAEQKLRESEQRYRLLSENIRDIIWIADLNMKYTYVSPSAPRFRGFTVDEIMNQSLAESLAPESYALAAQLLAEEVGRERSGQRHDPDWSKTIELEMNRKDGSRFWVEVVVSLLRNTEGEAVSILGVTRDITERRKAQDSLKRSEERFRSLFENSPDANMLMEAERIVDCNEAAVALFRADAKDDIVGRHPWELSPELQPDGRPSSERARALIRAVQEQGSMQFEWLVLALDGTPLTLEVSATIIPKAGKKILFASCRDITEHKKAEEERRVYEARFMRSQKLEAIGTLAGGIAHDFNNILSAIIGYAELALDDIEKNSPAVRCIDEVLKGGDRARNLVSQILTFSRQIQSEKKVVRMDIILKEALKLLRSSIPTTIRIVQNISPRTPAVLADPTHIHQVIMNLCTNAYQAMLERGGTLTVSLEQREVDDDFAREHPSLAPGIYSVLTVADTGHGMNQEIMNRIFEPFFTTREKTRGTGLGLSTVHGIVVALEGTVMVRSVVKEGSTFSVFLPAHEGGAPEEDESRAPLHRGNGERILLVDDETAILTFAKGMLEPLGYAVTAVDSSADALNLFSSDPDAFDLVITDQTMPLLTGMDLAARMLSIRPDLPVILATGFSETVSPEEALRNGIRVYLEKPFSRKALSSAIKNALSAGEA